jgi:hypothetical protein
LSCVDTEDLDAGCGRPTTGHEKQTEPQDANNVTGLVMRHAQLRRAVALTRSQTTLVGALALLSACGGAEVRDTIPTVGGVTSTSIISASPAAESAASVTLEQPAVWPAAGVVFESPEAAAEDFVRNVFDECHLIGEFQQGDSGSGEIPVLGVGDAPCPGPPRGGPPLSRLLLRQLGPDDGWFVTAAVDESNSITVPAAGSAVPAGPLTVKGLGSGEESTINVEAFRAGDADAVLDHVIGVGASSGPPIPYTVTVALSAASPGDVIALKVEGGSGIGQGTFTVIPRGDLGRSARPHLVTPFGLEWRVWLASPRSRGHRAASVTMT